MMSRAPIRTLLMQMLLAAALLAATLPTEPSPAPEPVQLKQATLDAFERYMRLTEERNDEELRRGAPLLWVDALPETQRQRAYARLQAGEEAIERLETRKNGRPISCPDGIIHH